VLTGRRLENHPARLKRADGRSPLAGNLGLGQLVTSGVSDRHGRKPPIAGGMLTQAARIAMIAATDGFLVCALVVASLGVGTVMGYPTLLAAIGNIAHPLWRARSVGVCWLWRDAGFAVGALLARTFR
jgi:MFS family permease